MGGTGATMDRLGAAVRANMVTIDIRADDKDRAGIEVVCILESIQYSVHYQGYQWELLMGVVIFASQSHLGDPILGLPRALQYPYDRGAIRLGYVVVIWESIWDV